MHFLVALQVLAMGQVLEFYAFQVSTMFAPPPPTSLDLCHCELKRGHNEAFDYPIVGDAFLLLESPSARRHGNCLASHLQR
jgi:hypothetical protein